MIEFIVMVKKATGEWKGLGTHSFSIPPRAGEYVTIDDEKNIGQAYRVKAIIHPIDPASTAADLILEYVSTDTDFRKNL